ncbi:MAG: hypothetical protein HQL53_07855 [Magnetococcales bacterium]|nr:hypothetical protein [Magnetococcales bacterium]
MANYHRYQPGWVELQLAAPSDEAFQAERDYLGAFQMRYTSGKGRSAAADAAWSRRAFDDLNARNNAWIAAGRPDRKANTAPPPPAPPVVKPRSASDASRGAQNANLDYMKMRRLKVGQMGSINTSPLGLLGAANIGKKKLGQ